MEKYTYLWTADCHGLEAVVPYDGSIIHAIKHRQHANSHRHCTYGTVDLYVKLFEFFEKLIRQKNGRQKAWFLLAGTKDEKIPIILDMIEKGGKEEVVTMISEGYEFAVADSSRSIRIIAEYPRLFKDKFTQEFIS